MRRPGPAWRHSGALSKPDWAQKRLGIRLRAGIVLGAAACYASRGSR